MTASCRLFLLWLLTILFMFRVVGQILVGIYQPDWLPSWHYWHSGLLPYPVLLTSQILLLMFMANINQNEWQLCKSAQKAISFHHSQTKHRLLFFSSLYVLATSVRALLTVTLLPNLEWLKAAIPIAFHLVLAAWLAVFASRKT